MRIAIVGSREYPSMNAVRHFVWECERTSVIVSGGAAGVDRAAVDEARRLNMPYEEHLPDWNRHGRRAGAIRNQQIVNSADEVVAFWDGKSKGTAITIRMAREAGRPVRVFNTRGIPQAVNAGATAFVEGATESAQNSSSSSSSVALRPQEDR